MAKMQVGLPGGAGADRGSAAGGAGGRIPERVSGDAPAPPAPACCAGGSRWPASRSPPRSPPGPAGSGSSPSRPSASSTASPCSTAAAVLSAWLGGLGPGVLAALLAALVVDWFITPPLYSITLDFDFVAAHRGLRALRPAGGLAERAAPPHGGRAAAVARRARAAGARRGPRTSPESNKRLAAEIAARARVEETLREQAALLDLTHDTIFVRDENDVIIYWNRGAEELYGWTQRGGRRGGRPPAHATVFSTPLPDIMAELARTGRWEGELVHTRRDGTPVVVASRWSLRRAALGRPPGDPRDQQRHHRAQAGRGGSAPGPGRAGARDPRDHPGRAGRLDRPRDQPAPGRHRRRRQRLPQLARRRAARRSTRSARRSPPSWRRQPGRRGADPHPRPARPLRGGPRALSCRPVVARRAARWCAPSSAATRSRSRCRSRRPAAGRGRSHPAPAGADQPARQRHRGDAGGPGRAPAARRPRRPRRGRGPRLGAVVTVARPRRGPRRDRAPTGSSTRSTPRSRAGSAWGCRSAGRSSRGTGGGCGPPRTRITAPPFTWRCP